MLISSKFEFYLYLFGGCRPFRVSAYPLGNPADGRMVYIKPAGHFVSGDRQVLRGVFLNMAIPTGCQHRGRGRDAGYPAPPAQIRT